MNRFVFVSPIAWLVFSIALIAPAQAQASPAEEWALVWSDEFEGDAIDTEKWGFDLDCWGGGNEERQCYTARPENAFVENGRLNIVARRENAVGPALPFHLDEALPESERGKLSAKPFTSARLTTKNKADWTYGRFEIRARAPQGQGAWAAAWMLPTEERYGAWAASGEIDILELVNQGAECKDCKGGKENRVYGTIHYGGEWPRNKYKGKNAPLPATDDGFNVYAVEWQEGEIRWYVDGQLYSTLTEKDWGTKAMFSKLPRSAPFDQPFYLILNLAIGGNLAEDTNEGGVSLEGFPKAFQIDWVRVYQRSADGAGQGIR
jgi:beta-glucanase (GH16 family)